MSQDKIIAGVTTLIGLATMVFGMSQETASVIQGAVPEIVGGVMALCTVITYLRNRQKNKDREFNKRSMIFQAMVYSGSPVSENGSPRLPEEVKRIDDHVAQAAKAAFGMEI